MNYELDGKKLIGRIGMHKYLKEVFSFPDYYGCNLDALWDCLYEVRPGRITIYNAEFAGRNSLPSLLRVLMDLCKRDPRWTLQIISGNK